MHGSLIVTALQHIFNYRVPKNTYPVVYRVCTLSVILHYVVGLHLFVKFNKTPVSLCLFDKKDF